ncbi:MAG: patatin-like phospholipase family protein [Candidatus Cloacimonetes bacterium]|nr:patatin-like phospholipase family protein [Candidatus Cloacimonadota bacterium]
MKKLITIMVLVALLGALDARAKIGLVLSGGGARGMAHIGVLKVLDELGVKPDYIAGTSTGALIGGLYACGMSGAEIETLFKNMDWDVLMPETMGRDQLHISEKRWGPFGPLAFELTSGMRPKLPQSFLASNAQINALFSMFYPYANLRDFSSLPIPFRCVGTNILTGELKVFSSGSLHEAVLASMTFPSLLEPFELDGNLYIDGGIMSNLPTEVVQDMGADIIIGVQVNSGLKQREQLENIIDVLDQTINIGIVRNIERSTPNCDILIKPELTAIPLTGFTAVEDVVAQGEAAARNATLQLLPYRHPDNKLPKSPSLPSGISFNSIKVVGNQYISNAKVREFVGLEKHKVYSLDEIAEAFRSAFSSRLFKTIYPTIIQSATGYQLVIRCKENARYRLNFNFTYNAENELTGRSTVTLSNTLQPNSKLLMSLLVGSKNELSLDYVKNFGSHWGIYFRLFPYIKEQTLYSYNDDHERLNSERSLEYGGVGGIGVFARKALIVETYSFAFHSQTYRRIADFEEKRYKSAGVGLKLYSEQLDDYLLPTRGFQLLAKLNATTPFISNTEEYKKFYFKSKLLLPITKGLSFKGQMEYGSFFRKMDNTFDPFYIGGIDSYPGLQLQEMSAPIYRYGTVAMRLHGQHMMLDIFASSLFLGNVDVWQPEKYQYHCGGMQLAIKSRFVPLRLAWAVDEEYHSTIHFSVGYELDPFTFSRR